MEGIIRTGLPANILFEHSLPCGRTVTLDPVERRGGRISCSLFPESVRSTGGADGGVVLDVDRGQLFRLNPVAALILDMLTRRCPEREIVQEIASRYSIGEEAAGADLAEFLLSLEQSNLIQRDGEEPAW